VNPTTWRLRRRLVAAAVSGALLLLAFPPFDLRYVAWVALVPLALALREATGRAGALLGLVAGVVFFGPLLYWLVPFGVVAWLPLVLLMTASWILAGWFGAWSSHNVLGRLLGIPLIFTAADMLRSRWPLGGFAWGLLGTTQHSGKPLLPLARVGGVFLVGLVVFAINASIAEVLAGGRWWRRVLFAVVAAALAVAPASLPLGLAGAPRGSLDIAAIQVNVREGVFGPTRGRQLGDEGLRIVEQFQQRSDALASDPPDLVIWPENALDRDPLRDTEVGARLAQAVQDVGRPFIVGAITDVDPTHFRNTLLFIDADASIKGRYDKQHLVPFGEYVPWPSLRDRISALRQVPFDGVPGDGPVTFEVGGVRIGGVICFESIFPELVRRFVDQGAQILLVGTNNASFGRTTAASEHLAQSQMRAVEEGRYLVHAAISGISAVVAPDGRILQRAGVFRDATLRARVDAASRRTPYAKYGGAIEAGIAGLGALVAAGGLWGLLARRRNRREVSAAGEFDWNVADDAPGEEVVQ